MNEADKAAVRQVVDQSIAEAIRQITAGRTPDLAKAYVAAWAEVGNVEKDARNPHLKNEYASLEAVMRKIKPVLVKHGLALSSIPGSIKDGNQGLVTMLVHTSGQAWSFSSELPLPGKAANATQAAGGCITYGRRYIGMGLFGIAPVDDDGEVSQAADDEEEDEGGGEDTDAIREQMATFKPNKGETAKEVVARFESEFKARVSASGDNGLVNDYISRRTEVKKAASKTK